MIRLDINYAKQLVLHWSHMYRCYSEQLNARWLLSCHSLFLRLSFTRRNCPLLSFPAQKNGNGHPAFTVEFSSATSYPFSIFSFSFPAGSHVSFAVSSAYPAHKIFSNREVLLKSTFWSMRCSQHTWPDSRVVIPLFRSDDISTMCTNFSESQILTTCGFFLSEQLVRVPLLMLTRRFYRKVQLTFKHHLHVVRL